MSDTPQSKSQKLLEIGKCIKDPVYAIENFLETFDQTQKGFVRFKLFPKQRELITSYKKERFNIVMKPRQAGVSTTTAAYIAVITAFADPNNPQRVLILANKQETAIEFLKKVKDFTAQLPNWMNVWSGGDSWFDPEKNSAKHYRLTNGSEVKAVATSLDALRGYTPTLLVMDEAAYIEGGEEVYAAAQPALSTGGRAILISCVTKDTFVFTDKGIKEVSEFIDDTKDGGYVINNYGVMGYGGVRHSNIMFNNGYVDTKIVKTKITNLEGSLNHKLYAYSQKDNSFGWYKLNDLSVGDYVSVLYNQNMWGNDDDCTDFIPKKNSRNKNKFNPNKITKDISYFMGLFLSEGSVYKSIKKGKHVGTSITISCGDDISQIFRDLNLKYGYDGKFHYTTSSKELGEFLEYIGFDLSLKAKNKVIPKRIFSLSKDNVIHFIRGFMDGDGYSRSDNGNVGLCSSSKRLIEQFRVLFMNIGILCEYQEKLTPVTKLVKVESMNYRLHMNSKNSKLYYDLIGFGLERKNIKKYNLVKHKVNEPYDVVPMGGDIIRTTYGNSDLGLKYFSDKNCKISHITRKNSKVNHVSRGLLLSYLDIINEKYNNVDENIVWVPIKDIVDSKNYTYDFSLPNNEEDIWCHSVLYNGMLGHQTPNGMDALYYKTYVSAKTKEKTNNPFNIVEMRWFQDPRYNVGMKWQKKNEAGDVIEEKIDMEYEHFDQLETEGWVPTAPWFEMMCGQLNNNPRTISQELLCAFNGSGDNVIDSKYIEYHRKNNVIDPIRTEWLDGNMWIWEDPQLGHEYILSADAASGSAEDSACICIYDFTTGNQVAEYHGKVAPDTLGEIAVEYGNRYEAFTVVDITGGYGVSTVLKMIELGYSSKKMYYDTVIGIDAVNNNKKLEKFMNDGKLPGLNFQKNRNTIITKLEESIRMNSFKVRSIRSVTEMDTFIFKNGRPDHMKGYHDDCLMAIAMCCYVSQTSFKDFEKSKGQAKAMLDSWVVSSNEVQSIPEMVSNSPAYKDTSRHIQAPRTEHNWVFFGMPGFKDKDKNKSILGG
jgi:intein/homing endonuclease